MIKLETKDLILKKAEFTDWKTIYKNLWIHEESARYMLWTDPRTGETYVLPEYRHSGVARRLFAEFEKDCKKHDIHQYYLIRATNENADRFYKKFEGVQLDEEPMLRKILKEN